MKPNMAGRSVERRQRKMIRQHFLSAVVAGTALVAMLTVPSLAQNEAPSTLPDGTARKGAAKGGGRGKKAAPARPTPRWPDGHVRLGPLPGEKGFWGSRGSIATTPEGPQFLGNGSHLPTNLTVEQVPFQPWARAVYEYRQDTTTKDDPHPRCKPAPGPRSVHPYGEEIIEMPEVQRIYFVGTGPPETWRVVYMDGRAHPKDLDPSFFGHQVGHWEGDSLVVDGVGFNEKFWLTHEGIPTTKLLHLIERYTRTDYNTLKYEVTIDDPGAYTATWTGGYTWSWNPEGELFEYICQDNNRDANHMYGGHRAGGD
jgi:hypothetical protein